MFTNSKRFYWSVGILLGVLTQVAFLASPIWGDEGACGNTRADEETSRLERFIVQGESLEVARGGVEAVGGEVTHELGILRARRTRARPARIRSRFARKRSATCISWRSAGPGWARSPGC